MHAAAHMPVIIMIIFALVSIAMPASNALARHALTNAVFEVALANMRDGWIKGHKSARGQPWNAEKRSLPCYCRS